MSTRSLRLATLCVLIAISTAGPATARDNVLRLAWGSSGNEFMATSPVPGVLTGRLLLDNPNPSTLVTRIDFKFNALGGDVVQVLSPYGDVVEVAPANWELQSSATFNLVPGVSNEIATFHFAVTDSGRVDVLLYSGELIRESGLGYDLAGPFGVSYDIYAGWVNAGEPDLLVTPYLFAPRGVNREAVLGNVSVRNNGDGPFFFDTAGLFDPCGPFRIIPFAGSTLVYIRPGGQTESFSIEFAPTSVGDYACNLPLGGGEFQPVQGVARTPIHALNPAATSVDFGGVAVGGLGRERVYVTNVGDYTETVAGVVSGDGTPLVADAITALPPDFTAFVDLEYIPSDYEPHAWTIDYGGLFALSATAYGIDGVMGVSIYPDTLRQSALEGESSYTTSVRVSNTGTVSFTPTPVWSGDSAPFTVVNYTPELVSPNGSTLIPIQFTAPDTELHEAFLELGPGLPAIPVKGRGLVDYPALEVWPATLVLPPAAVGDTVVGVFSVENVGNTSIPLELIPTDPRLKLVSVPDKLARGGYLTYGVQYIATEYAQVDARIVIDYEMGIDLDVVAPPVHPFGFDENRLGLYFDPGFAAPDTTVPLAPQVVPAWLVLRNPSESGGVAGWSCRLETSAGASLINVVPAGSAFDAASAPDEFAITVLGSPLPSASDIVLAQAQVLVLDPAVTTAVVSVRGLADSALPGLPTWTPGAPGAAAVAMAPASGGLAIGTMHLVDPLSAVDDTPAAATFATGLLPNVPNPFNPRTEIRFELAAPGRVGVRVYDVMGRLVRELAAAEYPAGRHAVVWDGRDRQGAPAASGAYYVRLTTPGGEVDARKILLLK
ncbi:hypothetical protein KDM41_17455 [bacterium]|nr:hypothetical protein [bacterium]